MASHAESNMENLVSKEYKELLEKKHNGKFKSWGGAVRGMEQDIHKYLVISKAKSILDYGAGASDFRKAIEFTYGHETLPYTVHEYEPGIPELAGDPPICDATICIDVLEHIEPDKIDNVLQHINDKTNNWVLFKVCLRAANGAFPTGENLHLTIRKADWWLAKFSKYWYSIDISTNNAGHLNYLAVKK